MAKQKNYQKDRRKRRDACMLITKELYFDADSQAALNDLCRHYGFDTSKKREMRHRESVLAAFAIRYLAVKTLKITKQLFYNRNSKKYIELDYLYRIANELKKNNLPIDDIAVIVNDAGIVDATNYFTSTNSDWNKARFKQAFRPEGILKRPPKSAIVAKAKKKSKARIVKKARLVKK